MEIGCDSDFIKSIRLLNKMRSRVSITTQKLKERNIFTKKSDKFKIIKKNKKHKLKLDKLRKNQKHSKDIVQIDEMLELNTEE